MTSPGSRPAPHTMDQPQFEGAAPIQEGHPSTSLRERRFEGPGASDRSSRIPSAATRSAWAPRPRDAGDPRRTATPSSSGSSALRETSERSTHRVRQLAPTLRERQGLAAVRLGHGGPRLAEGRARSRAAGTVPDTGPATPERPVRREPVPAAPADVLSVEPHLRGGIATDTRAAPAAAALLRASTPSHAGLWHSGRPSASALVVSGSPDPVAAAMGSSGAPIGQFTSLSRCPSRSEYSHFQVSAGLTLKQTAVTGPDVGAAASGRR